MRNPEAFEWNDENEARHVFKHGIPFAIAVAVFLDTKRYEVEDTRKTYSERRWNTVGVVDGLCINMTFAMNGSTARVISVRPAHQSERKTYGYGP